MALAQPPLALSGGAARAKKRFVLARGVVPANILTFGLVPTSKSSKSGSSTPKSSKIKARLGEDEDEGAGASGGGLGGEEAMEEESSLAVKAQGTLAELLERA